MKYSAKDQQKREDHRRQMAAALLARVSHIDYYHKDTLTGVIQAVNNLTTAVLLAADLVDAPRKPPERELPDEERPDVYE